MMPANATVARILCLIKRTYIFPVKETTMHAMGKYSLNSICKTWIQSVKICNKRGRIWGFGNPFFHVTILDNV